MTDNLPEPWWLLDSGAATATENMAVDEALLEAAPILGQPILRFYDWNVPAASFGYSQRHAEIERLTPLRPLVRRPTGGGLVLHGADWTYSIVVPKTHTWFELSAAESYRRVHEWIRAAFASLDVPAELAPCCGKEAPGQCFVGHEKFDVLWQGRKVAGAAQRRTRDGLLIQGSVQPPPIGLAKINWRKAFQEVARQNRGISWKQLELRSDLRRRVQELVSEKYSLDSYLRRR